MWQKLALGSLLDRTQDTFPDLQRKHCFSVFAQKKHGLSDILRQKVPNFDVLRQQLLFIPMFCQQKKHPIFTLSELTERKGSCSTQSNITAPEFRQVTQMAT